MKSLTVWDNLLLGKEYLLKYKQVSTFPFLSREEISAYQFSKIKRLLHIAYHQTEFYKHLYKKDDIYPEDVKTWADFRKLPTITKEDMIANHSQCIVGPRRNDNKLIISRSSGSSGRVMDILFESASWIEQALIMLRMYRTACHYEPFDKQALIYTSEYPYHSILGFYKASYIYTLTHPKEMMQRLLKLHPALIVAYPSTLLELIAQYRDDCQKLKPKALSTNSEHSTQEQRDFIASVFNCPVFDEYSTEELTLVGYQCDHKNYHLQEDCSYIEILDPNSDDNLFEGEVGEIVGTCLVNNVMPFIRYRQGDLGAVKKSNCSCGNNGRVLHNISGRKSIEFKLANGSVLPSGRVLDWTYTLLLTFHIPILQFQVTQRTLEAIEVTIVPDHTYNQRVHDELIITSFKKEFGEFLSVTVRQVHSIPKTSAGKHMPIRSCVDSLVGHV